MSEQLDEQIMDAVLILNPFYYFELKFYRNESFEENKNISVEIDGNRYEGQIIRTNESDDKDFIRSYYVQFSIENPNGNLINGKEGKLIFKESEKRKVGVIVNGVVDKSEDKNHTIRVESLLYNIGGKFTFPFLDGNEWWYPNLTQADLQKKYKSFV